MDGVKCLSVPFMWSGKVKTLFCGELIIILPYLKLKGSTFELLFSISHSRLTTFEQDVKKILGGKFCHKIFRWGGGVSGNMKKKF